MQPTIIILIGITGDLSKRKLLPALDQLKEKGLLPEQFRLVGITRHEDPVLFTMDLDNADEYLRLKKYLEAIEREWKGNGAPSAQRLFYLAVPPSVSLPIIEHLGKAGMVGDTNTKLLLEKPFGLDYASAQAFIGTIGQYISEDQVYRIDHYLAKASVRALVDQHINTNILEQVEIVANEKIGIEGRAAFYEQTGALRDFVQSHLLNVAATVLSPHDRLQALAQLYVPDDAAITDVVQRGQYEGYREAVGNNESAVETWVSVTLRSHDPLLCDLTVVLKTGKMLEEKYTDISLFYTDGALEIISLDDAQNAYEQVFLDAMTGDKTHFLSKEEVLQSWHIVTPVQEAWKENSDDLIVYEPGSSR